jgi:O-antigen ligase
MFKISSFDKTTDKAGKAEKFFNVLTYTIPLLMGIYIFFNPFPHTTAIKEFCFYISLLALIALIIFKKTNFSLRSPLTLPFILFFLWGVFGLFFALDLTNSAHDLRAHFLKYVAIYYLLVNYFDSRKKLEILSWIVISSATIFSLGAMIAFYFVDGNHFSARLGVTFLEIHTDYIGFVLIFALTLALNMLMNKQSTLNKFLLSLSALILCLTTLLTQSKGSLIALLIALIILSCVNKKILILLFVSLLLVVIIPKFKERITVSDIIQNGRVKINALTVGIIKSYPLTGIGFGMQIYGNENLVDLKKFDSKLPNKYQRSAGAIFMGSPHNTILDIAVRTGIIGLILFLNIVLTALWMLWKAGKSAKSEYFKSWIVCVFAASLSFTIAALFADATFGPPAIVFYTILAVITILWNINKQDQLRNNVTELQEN